MVIKNGKWFVSFLFEYEWILIAFHLKRWRLLFGLWLPARPHVQRWWVGPIEIEITHWNKLNVKKGSDND